MKRLLLGAAVSGALAAPAFAQTASTALPTGQQHGTGISVSTSGAEMTVNQSSAREIINWQSFSIGADAHVRFNLPGASSVVLNRVQGNTRSEIFGRLSSNGQVFLTNPNGVLFAPGANVEVGSLLATTLSITDQDFLAGRYVFANNGSAGTVVNRGNILTPNGYTALAAPQVRNEGVIIARMGAVALAAGNRVSLDLIGDGLISVSVDEAALNASVVNSGRIEAHGGVVLLKARSANDLLDTVVNTGTGIIRANRLEERDGQLVLDGGPTGIVRSSGVLDVGSVLLEAGEAYISEPGMPTLPGPLITEGHGPVIAPNPDSLKLTQESTRAIYTGDFSISASASMTFVQPSLTASSLVAVSPTGGTIQPITGAITITATSGQLGLPAPLSVTVLGAGLLVPPEALTAVPVSR